MESFLSPRKPARVCETGSQAWPVLPPSPPPLLLLSFVPPPAGLQTGNRCCPPLFLLSPFSLPPLLLSFFLSFFPPFTPPLFHSFFPVSCLSISTSSLVFIMCIVQLFLSCSPFLSCYKLRFLLFLESRYIFVFASMVYTQKKLLGNINIKEI